MANWYVNYGNGTTTGYYAVAKWTASHGYTVGNIVRQNATPTAGNERCFRCTTAGTSLSTEPTWVLTHGATTTESGGPVWTEVTGQEAYQSPGAWTAPAARIGNMLTSGWATTGDYVYVASAHAETQGGGTAFTWHGGNAQSGNAIGYISVICVDETGTGHVPPGPADYRTTAQVIAQSGIEIVDADQAGTHNGALYVNGLNFSTATGVGGAIFIAYGNNWCRFDNCSFTPLGTNNQISMGQTGQASTYIEWNNCTVSFPATEQTGINVIGGVVFVWKNTPNAIGSSSALTSLFNGGQLGVVRLIGVDLSSLGSNTTIVKNTTTFATWDFVAEDCKISSTVNLVDGFASYSSPSRADFIRCDTGGTNYKSARFNYKANLTTDNTVVRTGGATDGTTPVGWKIVTGANMINWLAPFETFPVAQWGNKTTSTTATMYGIYSGSALPNNDDIWLEMEYLGSSSTTMGSFANNTKATIQSTNAALTADSSSAWDSQATARVNSATYTAGQVIKLASNPGRIFVCTVGGQAASSEPAGYATAVDGGSVTDNAATFQAVVRFKMTVTFTPGQTGIVYAYPKIAKASSTIWIDPDITLA